MEAHSFRDWTNRLKGNSAQVHSRVDFFALWHWFLVLVPWILVMLLCWSWSLPSVSAEQLYIPG